MPVRPCCRGPVAHSRRPRWQSQLAQLLVLPLSIPAALCPRSQCVLDNTGKIIYCTLTSSYSAQSRLTH